MTSSSSSTSAKMNILNVPPNVLASGISPLLDERKSPSLSSAASLSECWLKATHAQAPSSARLEPTRASDCLDSTQWTYSVLSQLAGQEIPTPQLSILQTQLLNDLTSIEHQINSSGLKDHMTIILRQWRDTFAKALVESPCVEVVMAHIGLLHEKLVDRMTHALLDENALLGRDQESYHPETIKQFKIRAPELYKNRSPAHPNDATIFTSTIHPNIKFVVLWLKRHQAYLNAAQVSASFQPLQNLPRRLNPRLEATESKRSSSAPASNAPENAQAQLAALKATTSRRMQDDSKRSSIAVSTSSMAPSAPAKAAAAAGTSTAPSPLHAVSPISQPVPAKAASIATPAPAQPPMPALLSTAEKIARLRALQLAQAAREEAALNELRNDFESTLRPQLEPIQTAFRDIENASHALRARTTAVIDQAERTEAAQRAQLHTVLDRMDRRVEEIQAQAQELQALRAQATAELGEVAPAMEQWGKRLDAAVTVQAEREATARKRKNEAADLGGWLAGVAIGAFVGYVLDGLLAASGVPIPVFSRGLLRTSVPIPI